MKSLLFVCLLLVGLNASAQTAEYSEDGQTWYPIDIYTSFDWERCIAGPSTGCDAKEPMRSYVIVYDQPPAVTPVYTRIVGVADPDPTPDPDPVWFGGSSSATTKE